MARMVGRTRSTGGLPSNFPATPTRTPTTPVPETPDSDSDSIKSGHSIASSIASSSVRSGSGRAGFVRAAATTSTSSFTGTAHSSALGRGHNQAQLTQQNYQPFLDKTYLIDKAVAGSSAGSAMASSRISIESTASPVSRTSTQQSAPATPPAKSETIYVDIQIKLHEGGDVKDAGEKTLGFDINQNMRAVMAETCAYLDIEGVRPLYLTCKDLDNIRMDEGTLLSNKVKMDFVFELHVKQEADNGSTDDLTKDGQLVGKYMPNTIYLVLLMFNTDRQLLTGANGVLPSIAVSDEADLVEAFKNENKEFIWMRTQSTDYEIAANEAVNQGQDEDTVFTAAALNRRRDLLQTLMAGAPPQKQNSAAFKSTKFRANFFRACSVLQTELGLNRLGVLYHKPIALSAVDGAKLVVAVHFNSHPLDAEKIKLHGLKWKNQRLIHTTYYNQDEDNIWALYLQYYQRHRKTVAPGVYLGLFRVKNTTDTIEVLTLKHDPDMVPITRLRGAGSTDSFGGMLGQSTSRISLSRSKASADLLTAAELRYCQHLADKDRDPKAEVPADLTVTKELETLGMQLRASLKVLASQTGFSGLELKDLSHINPVMLRNDIMILMLNTTSELQAASKEKSGGGLLSKFRGMAKVKDDTAAKDDANPRYFEYAPLALFESMHHASYNNANYTQYRAAMEAFGVDQTRADLLPDLKGFVVSSASEKAMRTTFTVNEAAPTFTTAKLTAMKGEPVPAPPLNLQHVVVANNEKKKQWNATQSWALRIIQGNREAMMQSKK